jgi:Outer membrane protein beta-barrel domain
MRIYSFVLCTFLCTAGTAMAQPAVFGVKAGINLATVTFDPEPDEDVLDRRTGFVGGLFVVVPASDRLGFQGEVLFSQKGASEDGGAGDLALDYLEVPLLLRVGTASPLETSFHAFAGPSIGLRLRARVTAETFDGETEDEDIADDVKGFDFGVVAGAGVNFGRFTLDGRYTWGLNNLNSLEDDEMKLRNRVFSIMAGVRF